MIDLMGKEVFIKESGLKPIQKDDWGELFVKNLDGDEPLMVVKVINSTAEPDGSFKDYFLRVDPKFYGGIKTARAAVASTWRNEDGSPLFVLSDDYLLAQET